jgi:biopolymer transport protein ExbB
VADHYGLRKVCQSDEGRAAYRSHCRDSFFVSDGQYRRSLWKSNSRRNPCWLQSHPDTGEKRRGWKTRQDDFFRLFKSGISPTGVSMLTIPQGCAGRRQSRWLLAMITVAIIQLAVLCPIQAQQGATSDLLSPSTPAGAADPADGPPLTADAPNAPTETRKAAAFLSVQEMLDAGGMIGYLILVFSVVMVALMIDYITNIRRTTLMPPGLAEEIHRCLAEKKFEEGKQYCLKHPGFLSRVLYAGLDEAGLSYGTIEKAMEDATMEQSARLFRRVEYLSVISNLAPMLGLMGTVWGMILAFLEFEQKANPQVSELAPGIYRALVTTLFGLGVAIPSMAAFAFFRNRIDELTAETALLAEHVFSDYRRAQQSRRSPRPPGGSQE